MTKLYATKSMILREIAGESLLIPVGEMTTKLHGMISLSESGILLWKRMEHGAEASDLVACILDEYDVDRDTAVQDVAAFLEKMDQLGILERMIIE